MKNNRTLSSVSVRLFAILILCAGMVSTLAPAAPAIAGTTINVSPGSADSLANDGVCSLREAIIAANTDKPSGSKKGECPAGNGADTIMLPAGTYTLTKTDNGKEDAAATGDLDITKDVTIQGAGADKTIINATNFTDRIIQVFTATVTISGVTIQGGNVPGNGGGLWNGGTLTVRDSVIINNKSTGQAGGIYNNSGAKLTINNLTLSNNTAPLEGGGLLNAGGTVTMTNSTISGNTSNTSGGGIYNTGGSLSLNNVTIANNTADSDANGTGDGGGIAVISGTVSVKNTILGLNLDNSTTTINPDCTGTLSSAGYNLIQATSGCNITGTTTGNLTGVNPALGGLQNNGGTTPTMAPQPGSPAIDAGSPATPGSADASACEKTDQRGITRPMGSACDIGAVEVNSPVIIRAFPNVSGGGSTVVGRVSGVPNLTITLNFYTSATCPVDTSGAPAGTTSVTTAADGNVTFTANLSTSLTTGDYLVATMTGPNGQVIGVSACVRIGAGNDSWPHALELSPAGSSSATATASDYIDLSGQSRWYKFKVQPNSSVVVTLTNLPANYDLTLYRDIGAAYNSLSSPQDLARLGAEFAPDAFSPDAFSPDAFSPDAFSPDAFSPDAFSPDAFSPDAFSPDAFSPDAFSPDAFSPDAFSPDAFSPDAFSPDAFSPDAFSPDAFSPDAFSPDAFSSAQSRSLIGVSAFNGTASEGIRVNTWDNSSYFYVRVRGRNGAFNLSSPFQLQVTLLTGVCSSIQPITTLSNTPVTAGNYQTIILTDYSRLPGSPADLSALQTKLAAFAGRPEVAGVIVDVSQDARVQAANAQADAHLACPYAKNLVAGAIQDIVKGFRAQNPLQYVVIAGNDDVIPFFRYPDLALLASEQNYVPPVKDNTASQASLKLGYILGQDAYGSATSLPFETSSFPMPDLAVGRLVESAADIGHMLDVYMGTTGGVINTPASSLVTGYDFLADVAGAVEANLQTLTGNQPDALVTPRDVAPTDPSAWTASQLKEALLNSQHGIIFLAGHFSANSALAADYTTRLLTTDLLNAPTDWFKNTIVFSAGCHAGYNIVDGAGIAGVTQEPDWAQAFAQLGATLIAGTGYQYGDTDFIKYSEQIYLNFSKELIATSGPVSLGKALVAAKQLYLSSLPSLQGIDQKALLEATLFGLPMLSVNSNGGGGSPLPPALVSSVTPVPQTPKTPGGDLGLATADATVNPSLTTNTIPVTDPTTGATATATYLSGKDGTVANPVEPVLPLEVYNASVANWVLRGVGFRGGSYSELPDVLPLTGAATTEIRGVHAPFNTSVLFPIQPWKLNYYDALVHGAAGLTTLILTPAQYLSASPISTTGSFRAFSSMSFRLFYSNNISSSTDQNGVTSTPALSDAPYIARVQSSISGSSVSFRINAVTNPAAGVQSVWVTYTGMSGSLAGSWQSLDLSQDPSDSTAWIGTLNLNGTAPQDVRFMVQAVNGVGLVSLAANLGAYYIPGAQVQPTQPTALQINLSANSGAYGAPFEFGATLTNNGAPLANEPVTLSIGPQSRLLLTGPDGSVSTTVPLLGAIGTNDVLASFAGDNTYLASNDRQTIEIVRQDTQISLSPDPLPSPQYSDDGGITATLSDVLNTRLREKSIFFILSGTGGTTAKMAITDYAGRANLGKIQLPAGNYNLDVYFSGAIPLPGGTINLDDSRYNPASVSLPITISPENATVAYGGAIQFSAGTALQLSAIVTQEQDGSLGDITKAQVQYDVLDASGTVVATTTTGVNADGTSTASIASLPGGSYQVRITVVGGYFTSQPVDTPINIDQPPVCTNATASPSIWIWPPDGSMKTISITGVTDPDGDPIKIMINQVFQDEPVDSGSLSPDAIINADGTVQLRAQRSGSGDGRVYHIAFTAIDGKGGTCSVPLQLKAGVRVGVSDNQSSGGLDPIDQGPLYDSTVITP